MAIIVKKHVTIEISGEDVHWLSVLCKTTRPDRRTRLTEQDDSDAKAFADRILLHEDIWNA